MDSFRQNKVRRKRSFDSFDRRLDDFIETGFQVVDGVAGNRPGKRRTKNSFRSSSFENVGRWVGDKLDWILEEEEDWIEPWENKSDSKQTLITKKKPLEAISRRVPKLISPVNEDSRPYEHEDEWPEDSSFRVDRWNRKQSFRRSETQLETNQPRPESSRYQRPLPRSSRRRYE